MSHSTSYSAVGSNHDHKEESIFILPEPEANCCTFTTQAPVAVIGSGWFGRALTTRLQRAGYSVTLGRRHPDQTLTQGFRVPVRSVSYSEAIQSAPVVFLAIPWAAHAWFASLYLSELQGKVVVDVSNPAAENECCQLQCSIAETLARRLPGVTIIKAFNTVSAYALEYDMPGSQRQVLVCGDSLNGQRKVMNIARSLGYIPVDAGALRMACELERANFAFFRRWWGAVAYAFFLFVFFTFYLIIRTHVLESNNNFRDLPLGTMNQVLGSVTLVLLGSINLAGVAANLWQLVHRTSAKAFPFWLANWLNARRVLGLVAFMLMLLHVFTGVLAAPFSHLVERGKFTAIGQGGLLVGCIGFMLYCLLCVTSLPGVAAVMSWVEWRFVQSTCGWWALIAVTLHAILLEEHDWKEISYQVRYMPNSSILSVAIPALAVVLKAILLLPPVAEYLHKVQTTK
ncbi:Metalloreductase steap4 [Dimargaris verticillata]|uniref:Metalloreductase steap4 n=1 Tax=Dimargaris verticillata TaxID=2761393 RepID=A0A9W8B785_9FUNG|nr:Metalloreductase steap4 [Dimargaris verticillata]